MERLTLRKLLVANRGEIAVRIIRACREIGVETVAVYSDADASAQHVRLADEAIRIGPALSVDSYLNISVIIGAARQSKADAVHPGYGFLSQNPAFASACEEAGLIFVGPSPDAIARMGSKIDARQLMQQAGVAVVPGETPGDQSDAGIRQSIERVGLPVLVKASAGGGGKGMRLIREEGEIARAIPAARREAVAAFADGTLYIEKLIEHAHHVEVQVFGDHSGQEIVHLFERECSVQRRHQKVIEESPSPSIDAALRQRITQAGVLAARAAAYRNAGTVEFLVDVAAGSFYFLEMNTRLQVEHPVTEQVVGVDLVRAQLVVASNRPRGSRSPGDIGSGRLPWTQDALAQRGHAIEARVYAEDPERGFLPQAGRLLLYREPNLPGIRIDSGVVEGDEIPVYYDPLIAKVIATAETRAQAVARLTAALRAFPILGIRTNIPFLLRILDHPRFRAGNVDTGFLDAQIDSLAAGADADRMPAHVRAAFEAHRLAPAASSMPQPSWNPWAAPTAAGVATGGDAHAVRIGSGVYRAAAEGRNEIVYVAGSGDRMSAFWNGQVFASPGASQTGGGAAGVVHDFSPARESGVEDFSPAGESGVVQDFSPARGARRTGSAQLVTAPMPGTVLQILVNQGDRVAKGEPVVILEAMKMELPVLTFDDGTVATVRCREGELVQADAVLIELTS